MAYVNVTPMTGEDVLKLSGSGGDWHTIYLLIYGLSMKIKQMKVLQGRSQKFSKECARQLEGGRERVFSSRSQLFFR